MWVSVHMSKYSVGILQSDTIINDGSSVLVQIVLGRAHDTCAPHKRPK
jgi:hypothetical protein